MLDHIGGNYPPDLKAVEGEVWENSKCSSSYGYQAPGGIIDSMICAASPGKDSCSVSLVIQKTSFLPDVFYFKFV